MKNLPKLVKPYYTIKETFNRLKLAGTHLDQVDDILFLAKEGLLEVNLLLNKSTTLIKANLVRPFSFNKSFNFHPGQNAIDFMTQELGVTEQDVKHELMGINNPTFIIPKCVNNGELCKSNVSDVEINPSSPELFDQMEEKVKALMYLFEGDGVIKHDGTILPIIITPFVIETAHAQNELSEPRQCLKTESMFFQRRFGGGALEWNNEVYYTCKSLVEASYLSEMVSYEVSFNSGSTYRPVYALDREIINDLINAKSFVVTKEVIETFEQEHLKIKHHEKADSPPLFKLKQPRREQILTELIERRGQAELITLGRLGVWQELTEMDSGLFPFRDNAEDGTVKKFFTNQKLITFKRGR